MGATGLVADAVRERHSGPRSDTRYCAVGHDPSPLPTARRRPTMDTSTRAVQLPDWRIGFGS